MSKKEKSISEVDREKARQMQEEAGILEENEDVTKYGEFVSSYFAWLTLDKQKKKAKDMENMTKK